MTAISRTGIFLFVAILIVAVPQTTMAQGVVLDPLGMTVASRIGLPPGYQRVVLEAGSFGDYLRAIRLKPHGSLVRYFNGQYKASGGVYVAVMDLAIGEKDLHQCADAVMRLRSDWLYARKAYGRIHFNFLTDGKPRYWQDFARGDNSAQRFWQYQEFVFASANTRSLRAEMTAVSPFSAMQCGDVLIQVGNPYGHAVIVTDMAHNPDTGESIFLLSQSYMPAQELQVLQNPLEPGLSPWYRLDAHRDTIRTPEWLFSPGDLRRFNN